MIFLKIKDKISIQRPYLLPGILGKCRLTRSNLSSADSTDDGVSIAEESPFWSKKITTVRLLFYYIYVFGKDNAGNLLLVHQSCFDKSLSNISKCFWVQPLIKCISQRDFFRSSCVSTCLQ